MSETVRPRAREAVVVTGFGAVTPLGVGADVLHERAVAGASAAAGSRPAVRHADFAPADHLPRALVRRTDRFTHLALVAAGEALARAGHRPGGVPPWRPERVACVIGCGLGGTASFEAQREVYGAEGAEFVSPLMVPQMMANAAAAHLSMRYGFRGESLCVASACSSGAQAVGAGMRLLAAGAADAVVVGGAESAVSDVVAAAFANAGALSPAGRPGPSTGTGTASSSARGRDPRPGDGVRRRRAGRRGPRDRTGYGATSDAHHVTAPDPTGGPAARAVALALREAATEPGELAYANAHGTGTALNDRLECEALRHALGAGVLAGLPLSSSKGALGHLFGAAGAVEAIVTSRRCGTARRPRRRAAPAGSGARRPRPRPRGGTEADRTRGRGVRRRRGGPRGALHLVRFRRTQRGPGPGRGRTVLMHASRDSHHAPDPLDLAGRRYLVTGVLNDDSIAWHTARALQEAGAEVLLTGFGRTRRITEAAASGLPYPADVLELDVTRPEDLDGLTKELERRWGAVDGVLHAIAAAPRSALSGNFLTTSVEDATLALRTAAFSLHSLTTALAPLLREGGAAARPGAAWSAWTSTRRGRGRGTTGWGRQGRARLGLPLPRALPRALRDPGQPGGGRAGGDRGRAGGRHLRPDRRPLGAGGPARLEPHRSGPARRARPVPALGPGGGRHRRDRARRRRDARRPHGRPGRRRAAGARGPAPYRPGGAPVTAAIVGTGSALPERTVPNSHFEAIGSSDAWIVKRTGIRERRFLPEDGHLADLALAAAREALAGSGRTAADVGHVVVATTTPDRTTPGLAVEVAARLGADRAAAFDLHAACAGFVYALDHAVALIESGRAGTVLVCGAEALTRITDHEDRSTAVLLGDGAGRWSWRTWPAPSRTPCPRPRSGSVRTGTWSRCSTPTGTTGSCGWTAPRSSCTPWRR